MNVEVNPRPAAASLVTPVIQSVGVVGAGQMGNGIAHVSALAGLDVVMVDVNPAALDKARGVMSRNMDRQVAKGQITAGDKDAALGRSLQFHSFPVHPWCEPPRSPSNTLGHGHVPPHTPSRARSTTAHRPARRPGVHR